MTTLVWFYLGGIVGQAALVAANDDAARAFKRSVHWGGVRAAGGALIGIFLWPLTSLLLVLFGQALVRYMDQRNQTKVQLERCEVCGLEDETRLTHSRWLQDPPSWVVDTRGEGNKIFCSPRCAVHWAQHHEGKVA